jgi:hypothetical protein
LILFKQQAAHVIAGGGQIPVQDDRLTVGARRIVRPPGRVISQPELVPRARFPRHELSRTLQPHHSLRHPALLQQPFPLKNRSRTRRRTPSPAHAQKYAEHQDRPNPTHTVMDPLYHASAW